MNLLHLATNYLLVSVYDTNYFSIQQFSKISGIDLNTAKTVIMIIGCCVFQPAVGCWAHPKAGWTIFSSRFQPFLLISKLFQWFNCWNQQKKFEKEQKKCFSLLLKAGRHAKAGRLPEGVPRICLFSVDFLLFFNIFRFTVLFCKLVYALVLCGVLILDGIIWTIQVFKCLYIDSAWGDAKSTPC